MTGGAGSPSPPRDGRGLTAYGACVAVLVLAVTSQYFVPQTWPSARAVYSSLAGDLAVVYGLPIVAFACLVGSRPLRGWRATPARATAVGLGWYGGLTLLALIVTLVLYAVYASIDPGALKLLERPNPALQAAAGDPWFFVGFSFVIGAVEETIFRGWVFGFWANRTAGWFVPAVLSSGLFAALHIYYSTTYGAAVPLILPTLFLLGFAFAATYHDAGGNLVVVAALHGATDATAYLTLVSPAAGDDLHWLLVLVGALVGLVYYLAFVRPPAERGPPWNR